MISAIIYPSGFMLVGIVLYIVHFYLKSKKKDIVVKTTDFEEKKYSSPFSV
jgi:Na+/melibiose symporter-like transporter